MKTFLSQIIGTNDKIVIAPQAKRVKLDIGLSWNAPHSREDWMPRESDLHVFGFEPSPKNIHYIRQQSFPNNGSAFSLIPCALSSTEGILPFYCTAGDPGCSSLLKPIGLPVEEKIDVPVFKLESFFDLWDWDKIPFIEYIKIDAQGTDVNIIKGIGKYLDKIAVITAEAHSWQYEGAESNTEKEMDEYMLSRGFSRIQEHISPSFAKDPTYVNNLFRNMLPNIFYYQRG
jgi:FkbM family methyltransferase